MIYGAGIVGDYEACPIPPRGSVPLRDLRVASGGLSRDLSSADTEAFAEIALAERPVERLAERLAERPTERLAERTAERLVERPTERFAECLVERSVETQVSFDYYAPEPQVLDPELDVMRTLFSGMRQIARQNAWYHLSREEVFYRQAKLMEDFSDYYYDEVAFSCYFPNYASMDTAQLRSYFTWRTKVREGRINETSVSYAFLYIYELLHNIGVQDPQEGLDRLLAFWAEYRSLDPLIDKYVLPWLKDYHAYYPLETSFKDFAAANLLEEYYPTLFCFDSNKANSFELFASISAYHVKKSIFYTEETAPVIQACFFHVLTRLREVFQGKRRRFEDQIFHVTRRSSKWTPFSNALFYSWCSQSDRVVTISEREFYECQNGRWTGRVVLPSNHGSQLVGYIMKEVEVFIRTAHKFKYRLVANLDSCKAVDQSKYEKLGISIPELVKQSCAEFYRLHTQRTVSVCPNRLDQIRRDAYDTQEKLLVPEKAADKHHERVELAHAVQKTNSGAELKQGSGQAIAQHAALLSVLTSKETEALALAMHAGDLKSFARQQGIMLEVLIDTINEKAMDSIGDAVMELDGDEAFVFEDYQEELSSLLPQGDRKGS